MQETFKAFRALTETATTTQVLGPRPPRKITGEWTLQLLRKVRVKFGSPFSACLLLAIVFLHPDVALAQTAQTFNQIEFAITTGSDDLRGDSSATAALLTSSRSPLQVITLKSQTAPGWGDNTMNTVTATLNPVLTADQLGRIVITLTSHNSGTETDDNWNINAVKVSLSNNGAGSQVVMSATGSPLARLTGTVPSVALPPAGLGMTIPVDPPTEDYNPNPPINPNLLWPNPIRPTPVLTYGYQIPPSFLVDTLVSSVLTGTCSTSLKACLPQWDGTVNEQDGRLNTFLGANAASQDPKLMLARAVAMWLGLAPSTTGTICTNDATNAGTPCATAIALAQLAVTGRHAFNLFANWTHQYFPTAGGPQLTDLVQLARQGYTAANGQGVAAIPASVTDAQLNTACAFILNQAYTALWAIRSNDVAWRQFRLTGNFNGALYGETRGNWLAVSGEDDTPHRPVNVPSAPFPQFDIAVPMGNGTIMTRYMIATKQAQLQLAAPSPAPAVPAIPTVPGPASTGPRLAIPQSWDPTAAVYPNLKNMNVIIYIHGGGSRLEEAVPMAVQFLTQFGAWSDNLAVISFDLPNSGYDDTLMTEPTSSEPLGTNKGTPLDASSTLFEGGANGTAPSNVGSFPVLNFTINFINNFIHELAVRGYINPHQVLAIMGGSLGGNTSLLLSMDPMPAPFRLDGPLAFSPPQSAPGGGQPTIVAWSPTSMIVIPAVPSLDVARGVVVNGNMCCLTGPSVNWEPETTYTRSQYFYNLYFVPIGAALNLGLPPDPEMWYRDDWKSSDLQTDGASASITQSRFDRYEIYSPQMRLWTTALDTEQAIFSFQYSTDPSSYAPYYDRINARLLLATGACDDYDNTGTPFPPPFATGWCGKYGPNNTLNKYGIGGTGTNRLTSTDIYGFTHDVANAMRHVTGKTLFLNDTGHSIHDERPIFFAQQIYDFLTNPDSNINLTLLTDGDDLRWNSEAHAVIAWDNLQFEVARPASISNIKGSVDLPLNYWFHPWPIYNGGSQFGPGVPDNPCGMCYALTSFNFPSGGSGPTVNNFVIAMPSGTVPWINSFMIEFIAGTSSAGNTTDEWKLAAVAACLPGSLGGFISDGFPPTGVVQDFKPSSNNQPVRWQPPSFQARPASSLPNNCNATNTNFPPNEEVPPALWSSGIPWSN